MHRERIGRGQGCWRRKWVASGHPATIGVFAFHLVRQPPTPLAALPLQLCMQIHYSMRCCSVECIDMNLARPIQPLPSHRKNGIHLSLPGSSLQTQSQHPCKSLFAVS
ncbi:hypothetical protein BLNAU_11994 [Blattamonas nauphoetae]|uniref:Uncharacterized protein n=1 Tax=Blattamonas nauphoetae TaxID=2049346 RepID=A0ABQ9XRS5_9EUKA|nr:hypothetical protein BLNAU_11994 [Blattamonas nauphoetae]